MAKNQNTSSGDVMDRLVALCKRRGIIFPSSEIYGGIGSAYDYGPPGVEMKNNLSRHWWREMTMKHENIVGLDSAIIYNPRVWEASGHVSSFTDPMVECGECKGRFRDDEIVKEGQCPKCGTKGKISAARLFNMMLKTHVGPVEEDATTTYLRPETAQGIYIDYKIVMETSRLRPPFGIAQIGKAFRNEITTKNFIARTREFEQMEMQFFIKPGDNVQWCDYWREQRWNYLLDLGVRPEKLRWHEHEKLAHYARAAWDIEYEFPYGWGELEGLHDRGDFDLSRHSEFSGKDLSYFDDSIKERYMPHVIESSSGLNRALLMLLCEGYREDVQDGEERVYLSLDPRIAPIKAAFLPLVKKDGIFEIAHELFKGVQGRWNAAFDDSGSIGKRYRRQDEVGTPFCFTVDYQTKEDNTVTVRWRDTLKQERIGKDMIAQFLFDKLGAA